jgi:hypothetical protein
MTEEDPDSDPDPYLCLVDPQPGGPKTWGSGGSGFESGTLDISIRHLKFP